mmetsp:Transcript_4233/g.9129  ORF Transcript_4233/g.9129 Transcript_4233/m.9129 type:complete len:100 (-) Transcript_4233:31-330(-)
MRTRRAETAVHLGDLFLATIKSSISIYCRELGSCNGLLNGRCRNDRLMSRWKEEVMVWGLICCVRLCSWEDAGVGCCRELSFYFLFVGGGRNAFFRGGC